MTADLPAYLTLIYCGRQMREMSRTKRNIPAPLFSYLFPNIQMSNFCALNAASSTVSSTHCMTLSSTVNTDTHTYVRRLRISRQ